MDYQLIFFGYGSTDNTVSILYTNKIGKIWNDLYEKNQKELEKNIRNEMDRYKNKPQQIDLAKIRSDSDRKFELELDSKVKKEFQKTVNKYYNDDFVIYMLQNGYKVDISIIKNTIESIKKELDFLKNNDYSIIMDKSIYWNNKNKRMDRLDEEINFLEKFIQNYDTPHYL